MLAALEVFPSLAGVYTGYKGILLDAYGVFWGGGAVGLLPGSKEMMERLILDGKIVGILSNSTQLAFKEIDKLNSHGLVQDKHFHFLITSGEVARYIFLNEKLPFETSTNKFWLFGGIHPRFASHEAIFKDTVYNETPNIDEADFIYVSIPHINGEDQIDPELFREEIERIKAKNLPMICPNPDEYAHEGNPPRAVVRQGSIAKLYEKMGGEVFYIGKPHNKAYSIAMEQFIQREISDPADILMVGDTTKTDIRGANLFGMPSALTIYTGNMADQISRKGLEEALKDLPEGDIPTHLIERFSHYA